MKLAALIKMLGFRVLNGVEVENKEIRQVYAGDRMSDLLSAASDNSLIVTHLATHGIVRLIELMDVPAICFLNGMVPEAAVIEAACATDTCLVISPLEMYETCGRIHGILDTEHKGAPTL